METESAAASEDLRHHHRHSQQNHSRHSSGGENNNVNNNNNNNNNNSHPVEPDLSSEDGEFGSADEIGSEEASAWIARASRSLCEDSQGAPAGIDLDGGAMGVGVVAGGGGGGGVGVCVGGAGSSPPLQGEVNVTLWQFLLELLMSRQYSHVIQWTNREGEFQLLRAEEVARLWGMRKNKNHRMNYDKLSRALRYYYQKNIIKKVQGQKFVYRFVGLSDSVLRAPRSMGSAAAAAAAAAAAIATPPDGVSPKLEAVEDDLPASPHMEEPATIQAPLLFQPTQQQQQQQKSQSLTPPPQPSALTNARRLWQGGQQLHQQHHHIQHHQQLQQHQGLDLSLPHAAAAAAALIASSAASPPPPPPPLAPSKRLRTPESASATRSPESPPAKRPCCACRCHESQAESTATTAAAMAAVSTPRIKTEPTAAAAPAEAEDPADSGSLPSSYIQWLTLELAGGAGGIGGGGGGSGGGGPSFLHSSRHAANMKKLAEHIRLQKIFKRPPPPPPAPEPVAAVSTAATSSPSSMSHGLSHAHPHPAVSQPPPHPGPGLASSFGQSNGSPFSPPGCVWMPVPVAMLSQLWAGHEAAAAAVAAASAAAAAAAVAAAPSSCSSTSGGGGGCSGDAEDHGD